MVVVKMAAEREAPAATAPHLNEQRRQGRTRKEFAESWDGEVQKVSLLETRNVMLEGDVADW